VLAVYRLAVYGDGVRQLLANLAAPSIQQSCVDSGNKPAQVEP
jgi:hypothetical protein